MICVFMCFQGLQPLTEAEEKRIKEIISQISDNVRRRRLMMYPYFKDYDRVGHFSWYLSNAIYNKLHYLVCDPHYFLV